MFDNMVKDFKDYSELMLFTKAQHSTITELSKKIVKLEDENKHLKTLLETTTDIVQKPKIVDLSEPDEETISRIQLARIKENAFSRELSLEECKKVEVYTKIINLTNQNKQKAIDTTSRQIPTEDLVKLLEHDAN